MHRIRRVATARCPRCDAPRESVIHFVFECPAHPHERIRYFSQRRRKECDLSSPFSDPEAASSVVSLFEIPSAFRATFGELRDGS